MPPGPWASGYVLPGGRIEPRRVDVSESSVAFVGNASRFEYRATSSAAGVFYGSPMDARVTLDLENATMSLRLRCSPLEAAALAAALQAAADCALTLPAASVTFAGPHAE